MSNNYLDVNRIVPFSNVDGPGNRFAVFLQECNINCRYCHNPETINRCNSCGVCVANCPVKALFFNDMSVTYDEKRCVKCDTCISVCPNSSSPKVKRIAIDEMLKEIKKSSSFLSGVSFSGGECSLQHQAITELFSAMKHETPGLTRLIDTNGYMDFEPLTDFIKNSDMFVLDIKAIDEKEHINLTGKSNKTILKNLDFLLSTGKLYEVRTVICPDLFNCEETVSKVSKLLRGTKVNYKLTPFRPHGVRKEFYRMTQPSEEYMQSLELLAKGNLK